MGKGTGFGKTILIGDQFVLYGVPAIVSALPFQTTAKVERVEGVGWTLEDNRNEVPGYKKKKKEQQVESINRILQTMKIDVKTHPLKITYGGALLAGSGVGASAASCVSLARALNEEFTLGLSIEEINQIAWEGEFAYHGLPSGVDNTASTYGGILLYHVKDEQKSFHKIVLEKPLEVVLGNSGITANTALLRGCTERLREDDEALFWRRLNTIKEQVTDMKLGLESGDLQSVGSIMTENHRMLIDMGISHKKLVFLCNLAMENGAYGAKLTGGGMGGYMVALTPGKGLQERVASALENDGFAVIRATIGGN